MEQPPSILKSPLPKHFSAQSHLGLAFKIFVFLFINFYRIIL